MASLSDLHKKLLPNSSVYEYLQATEKLKSTSTYTTTGEAQEIVEPQSPLVPRKCPCCGAPVPGDQCEYCGAVFTKKTSNPSKRKNSADAPIIQIDSVTQIACARYKSIEDAAEMTGFSEQDIFTCTKSGAEIKGYRFIEIPEYTVRHASLGFNETR